MSKIKNTIEDKVVKENIELDGRYHIERNIIIKNRINHAIQKVRKDISSR